jgi:hypothetical protein
MRERARAKSVMWKELRLAVYGAGGVSHGIDPEVQEYVHDVGIELAAALPSDLFGRLFPGSRGSIGTICGHRVERISECGDARMKWDVFTGKPVIAASVPSLVVRARDDLS